VVGVALVIAGFTSRPTKVSGGVQSAAISPSDPDPLTGPDSAPSLPSKPDFDASPYILVASVAGHIYLKNPEAERFSDSIDLHLRLKNLTDKTIVGVRGQLAVLDGFGIPVYSFGFRDDNRILPKSDEDRGAYSFEHNQFESDDPYSRMYPLIDSDTAKYQVTITNIAFSDGSVLPRK
jgi:hypothetical protein